MHIFSSLRHLPPIQSWFFLLIWLVTANAWALDPLLSIKIGEAEAKLRLVEQAFSVQGRSFDLAVLREYQTQGLEVRKIASECINKTETEINKSADDLELLGPQAVTEDPEVTEKRLSLNQNMLSNAQNLASCRLMLLRANEMIDISLLYQQQTIASELLAQTDDVATHVKHILLNPGELLEAVVNFIISNSGIDRIWADKFLLLGLLLLVVLLILILKKWFKRLLKRYSEDQQKGYLSQCQLALVTCFDRYIPTLMLLGVFSAYYGYHLARELKLDFIGWLVIGLFLYVVVTLVIRMLLNPCAPAQRLTQLPEKVSLLLARRLRLLSKLILLGFLMFIIGNVHDFPEHITGVLRNIYLFLLVLNLSWVVWLFRYYEGVSNIHFIRALIIVGLLGSLVADWFGYFNLANYILIGITGSILLWAFTIFLLRVWTDLLDSLDEGRSRWQRAIRKRIGVKEQEYLPGSIWFRFTFAILIWSAFAVALLKIWGLPDTTLIWLRDTVTEGFDIGTVRVVPGKVVLALLMFAVMLSIIGWIKRRMEKSWLNRSRMDHASKESMISLTGYFAVAMAFLLALSMAGVELANIALIAGALSVGIGFGLQNIVNNFISGVILLFERPIKTGDWIVVGGTEGYVKKISIRSTQIQTFDRSDVIVPNSELISTQVTNWMFRDKLGRVIVPIGVAYGTDVELVKQILLDIAYQHPSVITKSPIISKPWVLFRTFGDSSLNFELRCYIRAVDDRLSVISDINFAIDKAFRDADIQIPFPQRDVHMINDQEQDPVTNKDQKVITKEE